MVIFDNIEEYIFQMKHKSGQFALLNNDSKIQRFYGKIESEYNLQCMLAIYYPPGGGLGWHVNDAADMHNALCTYSTSKDSFIQLENEKIYDKENEWSVKYTYWTRKNSMRHRVVSYGKRITFAFSSPKEDLVRNFIEALNK